MNLTPILIGGGLLAGGYFLFFTDAGKNLIASITGGGPSDVEKWDNPFKYLTPATAGAWNPKSKMYQDIQKRIKKKYQTIDELYE